jgi:FKBP-type peptidyl-prolyl cis-trans isomerase 2
VSDFEVLRPAGGTAFSYRHAAEKADVFKRRRGITKMVYRSQIVFTTVFFLNVLFVFHCSDLPAAETGLIKPGDKVGIQFTCRFKNGEIASSTSTAVARNTEPKSAIFLPRSIDDPVAVTAGESSKNQRPHDFIAFEDEIITQLAHSIAGMPQNGSGTIELHADRITGLPPKDEFMQLARVRVRPKEMRMTVGEFKVLTGKEPALGEEFTSDLEIPGKVASVSENEVLIRFFVQPGSVIDTPFGKGTIRENEKNYEIVIDVSVGKLVRMKGLVGRISEVQDRMFTIDYGNPFGGETLTCDVKVEPAPPADAAHAKE